MQEMLALLRSFRAIHKDIKPENILVDNRCMFKLCDFGMSHTFVHGVAPWICERIAYSRWYRAPQVCVGRQYSFGADTWAMGCVLYELVESVYSPNATGTNCPLFGGDSSLLSATTLCVGTPDGNGRVLRNTPLIEEGEIVERVSVSSMPTAQIVCIYKVMAPEQCGTTHIDVTRMGDVLETRRIDPPHASQWPVGVLQLFRHMCRFQECDRLSVRAAPTPPSDVVNTLEHTLRNPPGI
jgi:serine/threonine protein kinase